MNKFFVVINGAKKNDWSDVVWKDASKVATIYLDNNVIKNLFLKKLKEVHFSNKLNKRVWLPFKWIWDWSYPLKKNNLKKEDCNFLIFQSNVKFSPSFIRKLKQTKNTKIILYLPDTTSGIGIGNCNKNIERYKKYYEIDYIFSFDMKECKKYGFFFFDIYSKLTLKNENNVFDLIYVGSCRNENRRKEIESVFDKVDKRINYEFDIVDDSDKRRINSNSVIYNKPLSYVETVKKVLNSNCILELININQSGNTLRFKEAICYNKKLLTNNKNVLYSKYYNPRFIQYFHNPKDIDVEWLMDESKPQYKYVNEFSPINLFNSILSVSQENGV